MEPFPTPASALVFCVSASYLLTPPKLIWSRTSIAVHGLLRDRLRALLRGHRLQLLEAFAQAIADLLINDFGAVWVRVKVIKPRRFEDVEAVGVMIEREASRQTGASG